MYGRGGQETGSQADSSHQLCFSIDITIATPPPDNPFMSIGRYRSEIQCIRTLSLASQKEEVLDVRCSSASLNSFSVSADLAT